MFLNKHQREIQMTLQRLPIIAVALGITTFFGSVQSAIAQSGSRSFRNACSYTLPGKTTYQFNCRWMIDGTNGRTIFVDNNDTDDHYEVAPYQFQIGPGSQCITNGSGVRVCRLQ